METIVKHSAAINPNWAKALKEVKKAKTTTGKTSFGISFIKSLTQIVLF